MKVLIVEDDAFIRGLIAEYLSKAGFAVTQASNAAEASRLIHLIDPDALVLDIDLGAGPSGIDLVKGLNLNSNEIGIVFYKTQINPDASQKRLVAVGRISTVVLMVLSTLLALLLQNAMQLFNLLLVFGAGTGLIFILRWFWWRINAWSEITAMIASGVISLLITIPSIKAGLFGEVGVFPAWAEFPFVVFVTTSLWLLVTFITPSEDQSVLRSFYKKTQPGGPGWKKIIDAAKNDSVELVDSDEGWSVPSGITAMLLGCGMIYGAMFATGYWIYGEYTRASIITLIAAVFAVLLVRTWKKVRVKVL